MTTHRSTRPDHLATLTALRPDTSGRAWGAVEQAAARERVMAVDARAAAPVRRARRRHRHVTALALSGLLVVGGAGAAAAAGGLLPQSFTDAFSGWGTTPREGGSRYEGPDAQAVGPDRAGPAIDPSTGQRVASAPGPNGTVFTLVTAHATDPAYQCTAVLFESPTSAGQPLPSDFRSSYHDTCQEGPAQGTFDMKGTHEPEKGVWTWSATAGDAVRATLVGPDGTSYPVLGEAGALYGWFPGHADLVGGTLATDRLYVLTGYAADGSVVGHLDVLNGGAPW